MKDFIFDFLKWLKRDGALPWVLIVFAFIYVWPVGILLTLTKLDILHPEKLFEDTAKTNTDSRMKKTDLNSGRVKNPNQRKKEYKTYAQNMFSVSIDELAGYVGVEDTVVIRDLQEMIIEGEFGSSAYIDYNLKRLFIKSTASSAQTENGTNAQETKKAAENTDTKKNKSGGRKQNVNELKQRKKKLDKVYLRRNTFFLILGIALCVLGVFLTADAIDTLTLTWNYVTFSEIWRLICDINLIIAGGALLGIRSGLKKRIRRFGSYISVIGDKSSVSIEELSSAAGVKESTVKKDIAVMLEKKLLGDAAYLDIGAGRLVLRQEAKKQETEQNEQPANKYHAIIMEIRHLNDEIADETVSEKIDKIEELTAKIFKVVEDKPEKQPEIRSFMSYYLPTTLKLLRSYSAFEKQGVSGENIDATKERIEKILDTLISGYSQQLDQLFKSDAMDISSDIDVLENMMRRDGLSKDESGFQVGL